LIDLSGFQGSVLIGLAVHDVLCMFERKTQMSASGAEQRMSIFEQLRLSLPSRLPAYLTRQRWFGGKARKIRSIEIADLVPLQTGELDAFILLARVEYEIGTDETYVLPMFLAAPSSDAASRKESSIRLAALDHGQEVIVADALKDESFLKWLLDAVEVQLVSHGTNGDMGASYTKVFQDIRSSKGALTPRLINAEQSNSSVVYGDSLILKFFRRLEGGINPDLEIGLFLTEKTHYRYSPPVAGSIEYAVEGGESSTVAILQGFIPNQGDAWRFTLESVALFWDELSRLPNAAPPENSVRPESVLDYDNDLPSLASDLIGSYLGKIRVLGKRTAELHLALASDSSDPAFAPEPYTAPFQQEFERSTRALTERTLGLLRQKRAELPDGLRHQAEIILNSEPRILQEFQSIANVHGGLRTRIHGDYHLGQVLYTGSDFAIIDFEGEPARPLSERRLKRSPLQDVAGMVRSFHYAAFAHLLTPSDDSSSRNRDLHRVTTWAETWYSWVTFRFLKSYFANAQTGSFLPDGRQEISALLRIHLLEKAIYELGYELNNRPAWVAIPLAGISRLLAQ
jgi:maltose alpha-D-glucosyltransferase/alpha-amylase